MSHRAYPGQVGHLVYMNCHEYIVIYELYSVSMSNGTLSVYGSY